MRAGCIGAGFSGRSADSVVGIAFGAAGVGGALGHDDYRSGNDSRQRFPRVVGCAAFGAGFLCGQLQRRRAGGEPWFTESLFRSYASVGGWPLGLYTVIRTSSLDEPAARAGRY